MRGIEILTERQLASIPLREERFSNGKGEISALVRRDGHGRLVYFNLDLLVEFPHKQKSCLKLLSQSEGNNSPLNYA